MAVFGACAVLSFIFIVLMIPFTIEYSMYWDQLR